MANTSKWYYRNGKSLPKTSKPLPIRHMNVNQTPLHVASVEVPKFTMFLFEDEFYSPADLEQLNIDVGDCRPMRMKVGIRVTLSDKTEFFFKTKNVKEKDIFGNVTNVRSIETVGWTNPLNGAKKSMSITEFKLNFSAKIVDMVLAAKEQANEV